MWWRRSEMTHWLMLTRHRSTDRWADTVVLRVSGVSHLPLHIQSGNSWQLTRILSSWAQSLVGIGCSDACSLKSWRIILCTTNILLVLVFLRLVLVWKLWKFGLKLKYEIKKSKTYLCGDSTRHYNLWCTRIIDLIHLLHLSLGISILRPLISHIDS